MTGLSQPEAAGTRRAMTARVIRVATLTPVVVIGGSAVALDSWQHPVALTVALAVIAALVLLGLTPERLQQLEEPDPSPLLALIGVVAVIAGAVALTAGDRFSTDRLTIVFGVVIVTAAFVLPDRQRRPLIGLAVVAWTATSLIDGERDPVTLFTQLAGAAGLAYVALLCTRSLETALEVERQASRSSRTRASLLTSVLRLQVLEPRAVAEAVVRGAREAGLDSALLRVVDGDDLRLVAARPLPEHDPVLRLPAGEGIAGIARRTGRPVVVNDYTTHPAKHEVVGPVRGAIAVPIVVDGEVSAVLFGGRRSVGLAPVQVHAVELLAEEAGAALSRARRFAADADTVAELRRLDDRTHDFVSTVSHELRTPMTVVHGLGQTVQRRWDDLTPERRADLLRRIDENAERLAVMVRSLVDTSALDRGRLEAHTSRVVLAESVAAVLGRLAPVIEAHPVAVEVDADLAVWADPSLLEHVLENLLSNAARHTPAGTEVVVRAWRRGADVEVEVADDGPGIPADDLPHVIERFYRVGEPTTRPSGGLGLGLALSQQILQAHGQELTVRSEPGRGTVFAFELRAAPTGEGPPPTGAAPPPTGAAPPPDGEAAPPTSDGR